MVGRNIRKLASAAIALLFRGLHPELRNGWLAFDRDQAGRSHYRLGKSADGPPKGYEYVAKTPEELKSYLTSFKLLRSVPFALEHPIPEHLREREDDNAPVAGSYTMRATFTDVFGCPAIAYEMIFLQE